MERARSKTATDKNRAQAMALYIGFIERLRTFQVLHPACGSGNFLYIALRSLKDLEHRVNLEAEALGLDRQQPTVGPANVSGIEINNVAAELARVTVWIGEIQWMLDHGYPLDTDPVLRPLENITCTDALVDPDGRPTAWPEVQAIVGNPPFLGVRRMIRDLGEQYTTALRRTYANRGVSGTDLVTFWFERVREAFATTTLERAGLVSTNSIRDGANRAVLDRLVESATLETAWSDEPWVNEGAAVRVSILCAARPGLAVSPTLDGVPVDAIRTDLSASSASGDEGDRDPKRAPIQSENADYATQGPVKAGAFEISGKLARAMLDSPNAHGGDNAAVLRPWLHGDDVTGRPDDMWIIDFDGIDTEQAAARFEAPFQHVLEHVRDKRQRQRDANRKRFWWRHGRAGTDFRAQTKALERYIATLRVSMHRIFVWADSRAFPDSRVLAIASEADSVFGVLHSSVHKAWTLSTCSWHGQGNDPTYNKGTCFERFAFPSLAPLVRSDEGAGPEALKIAEAARELERTRRRWLHPPQWCDHPGTGEPGRGACQPREGHERELAARTPTRLYNDRPAWLAHLHEDLDRAVLTAYGWQDDPSPEEIVNRLVALADERGAAHGLRRPA